MNAELPDDARPQYFVLGCVGPYPPTAIAEWPDLDDFGWYDGQPVTSDVPVPLRFMLDADYPGNLLPFYDGAYPLMNAALLAALRQAGVDNLQTFDAQIDHPSDGLASSEHRAVNIIGMIRGVDAKRAVRAGTSDSTMIDVDYDSMPVDSDLVGGLLLFRLAESVSTIVVHRRVRDAIESAGIEGMTFYLPEDWGMP